MIGRDINIMVKLDSPMKSAQTFSNLLHFGINLINISPGSNWRSVIQEINFIRETSKALEKDIKILLDLPSPFNQKGMVKKTQFRRGELLVATHYVEGEINKSDILINDFDLVVPYLKIGHEISTSCKTLVFEVVEIETINQVILKCIKVGEKREYEHFIFPDIPVFQDITEIIMELKKNDIYPEYILVRDIRNESFLKELVSYLRTIFPKEKTKIITKVDTEEEALSINVTNLTDGYYLDREELVLGSNPFAIPAIQDRMLLHAFTNNKFSIVANGFFKRFAVNGIINRPEISDITLLLKQNATAIGLCRDVVNSEYFKETIAFVKEIENEFKKSKNV